MKNLMVFLLLFVSINGIGQRMHIGLKGGGTLSYNTGGLASLTKAKVGYHFGLITNYKITEKTSSQIEIFYNKQGAYSDQKWFPDYSIQYDYLQLPVLLKYYFTNNFSIEVGPQLGLLMDYGPTFDDITAIEISVFPRDYYFSLVTGFSYQFDSNTFLQARYNFALQDVDFYYNTANPFFSLSFGYEF